MEFIVSAARSLTHMVLKEFHPHDKEAYNYGLKIVVMSFFPRKGTGNNTLNGLKNYQVSGTSSDDAVNSHKNLKSVSIVTTLQMGRLRPREAKPLPEVTMVGGSGNFKQRLPAPEASLFFYLFYC